MLCSYCININVMANLMLVQCVIASWTYLFRWKFYQEMSVTMVHVPEGIAVCQLKVNITSNRKKVMFTKDAPLSSHLAVYVL